jgi:hypothetical protein
MMNSFNTHLQTFYKKHSPWQFTRALRYIMDWSNIKFVIHNISDLYGSIEYYVLFGQDFGYNLTIPVLKMSARKLSVKNILRRSPQERHVQLCQWIGMVSMGRVGFGLDHIILLFFLIRFELNPIKFGSKNLNSYPT